jgi:hypothetical protein
MSSVPDKKTDVLSNVRSGDESMSAPAHWIASLEISETQFEAGDVVDGGHAVRVLEEGIERLRAKDVAARRS